jgi:hypothetical protein
LGSWTANIQHELYVKDDERILTIVVRQAVAEKWAVIAAETSSAHARGATDSAADGKKVLEKVFDDHAHAVLGVFTSAPKAMKVGEKYARAWVRARKKAIGPTCGCGEISAPASASVA